MGTGSGCFREHFYTPYRVGHGVATWSYGYECIIWVGEFA